MSECLARVMFTNMKLFSEGFEIGTSDGDSEQIMTVNIRRVGEEGVVRACVG